MKTDIPGGSGGATGAVSDTAKSNLSVCGTYGGGDVVDAGTGVSPFDEICKKNGV